MRCGGGGGGPVIFILDPAGGGGGSNVFNPLKTNRSKLSTIIFHYQILFEMLL